MEECICTDKAQIIGIKGEELGGNISVVGQAGFEDVSMSLVYV